MKFSFQCLNLDTVFHEIMHAYGFYHEHSRSDRDQYIDVNLFNLQEIGKTAMYQSRRKNYFSVFEKMDYYDMWGTRNDLPYDYHSIMHYDPSKGKCTGCNPVIKRKDGSPLWRSCGKENTEEECRRSRNGNYPGFSFGD